ncbi:uncharacterized protein MELLADRAFT_107425 [Melampsora larici-populina 98AG31]|uniref:Secreted protein n=1 Tax=Melampsora larici-populina (strain 98AG31 / pathotype 3-4-7) TaxID=747676 RepID=F4RPR5_MELLP|nr:uncharacterized protein MELLADRAFT_107425 [Melampsora larici-populina 98AG31]EGG05591.1 hypothetical protein MELLADRAFT_107425 [Melampsora larici-populina 98AG31]
MRIPGQSMAMVMVLGVVLKALLAAKPGDELTVFVALSAGLDQVIQQNDQVKQKLTIWFPCKQFKDHHRKFCAQLFLEPSLQAFSSVLMDAPNGVNDRLGRRVLDNLLTNNVKDIKDNLPKGYIGDDGSQNAAAVSVALKEAEKNAQSTFQKLILHHVLPSKGVNADSIQPNLRDFCGHRLASVCVYSKPAKDFKSSQWSIIDESLLAIKNSNSIGLEEATMQYSMELVLMQLLTDCSPALVLPTSKEVFAEVNAPSKVPECHKSQVK